MVFALLELKNGANQILMDYDCPTQEKAVEFFKKKFPDLNLDKTGYCKIEETSYCVASYWLYYESY